MSSQLLQAVLLTAEPANRVQRSRITRSRGRTLTGASRNSFPCTRSWTHRWASL